MQPDRTAVVTWTDSLAAILAGNPNAQAITVEFTTGGRLRVDRDGARFIAKGETVDIDAALAEEGYEVTPGLEMVVTHEFEGEV